jgi:hypothetical protein
MYPVPGVAFLCNGPVVSALNGEVGAVNLVGCGGTTIGTTGQSITITAPVAGVSSLNSLTGAVTLAQGANITVVPSGNTVTISSTASGSGGINLVNLYCVAGGCNLYICGGSGLSTATTTSGTCVCVTLTPGNCVSTLNNCSGALTIAGVNGLCASVGGGQICLGASAGTGIVNSVAPQSGATLTSAINMVGGGGLCTCTSAGNLMVYPYTPCVPTVNGYNSAITLSGYGGTTVTNCGGGSIYVSSMAGGVTTVNSLAGVVTINGVASTGIYTYTCGNCVCICNTCAMSLNGCSGAALGLCGCNGLSVALGASAGTINILQGVPALLQDATYPTNCICLYNGNQYYAGACSATQGGNISIYGGCDTTHNDTGAGICLCGGSASSATGGSATYAGGYGLYAGGCICIAGGAANPSGPISTCGGQIAIIGGCTCSCTAAAGCVLICGGCNPCSTTGTVAGNVVIAGGIGGCAKGGSVCLCGGCNYSVVGGGSIFLYANCYGWISFCQMGGGSSLINCTSAPTGAPSGSVYRNSTTLCIVP